MTPFVGAGILWDFRAFRCFHLTLLNALRQNHCPQPKRTQVRRIVTRFAAAGEQAWQENKSYHCGALEVIEFWQNLVGVCTGKPNKHGLAGKPGQTVAAGFVSGLQTLLQWRRWCWNGSPDRKWLEIGFRQFPKLCRRDVGLNAFLRRNPNVNGTDSERPIYVTKIRARCVSAVFHVNRVTAEIFMSNPYTLFTSGTQQRKCLLVSRIRRYPNDDQQAAIKIIIYLDTSKNDDKVTWKYGSKTEKSKPKLGHDRYEILILDKSKNGSWKDKKITEKIEHKTACSNLKITVKKNTRILTQNTC